MIVSMHTTTVGASAQLETPALTNGSAAATQVPGGIHEVVQMHVEPMLSGLDEVKAMQGEAEALALKAKALAAEVKIVGTEGEQDTSAQAELVQRAGALRTAASALYEKMNAWLDEHPLIKKIVAPALAAGVALAPSVVMAGEGGISEAAWTALTTIMRTPYLDIAFVFYCAVSVVAVIMAMSVSSSFLTMPFNALRAAIVMTTIFPATFVATLPAVLIAASLYVRKSTRPASRSLIRCLSKAWEFTLLAVMGGKPN